MAVIGSIRKRSGLLLIIVGGALLTFILGELFNSGLGGQTQVREYGQIDGVEIGQAEFSKTYGDIKTTYQVYQSQSNPSEDDFKRYAWDELVKEKVLYSQIERAGIRVTGDEVNDMMYGEGVLEEFKNNPQFQENGVFNGDLLENYYDQIFGSFANQDQALADMLYEREIARIVNKRKEDKYQNLINKGLYATSVEAKDDYNANNATMDVSFVYKRYTSIPDSTIEVSDSEIQAFYDDHKNESKYFQNESRSLAYVSFDAKATTEDIEAVKQTFLKNHGLNLAQEDDTSTVARHNAQGKYINYYSPELPDTQNGLYTEMVEFLKSGPVDTVSPVFADPRQIAVSLLKIKGREFIPDSAKASHILIAHAGAMRADPSVTRDVDAAKELADSLFQVINADNAQFEELARNFSDGPTASKAGDLGWFVPGTMAPEFNDFCFNGKEGDVGVVKTVFGYHVINIKELTDPVELVKYVQIDGPITASSETRNEAYKKAQNFHYAVLDKGLEQFETQAKDDGYLVLNADKMPTTSRTLQGIVGSERTISWAFAFDTEENKVSEPYEANGQYIVSILKEKIARGVPKLEHVKEQMKLEVLKEKKAAMIREEWNGINTLEDIAELEGLQVLKGSQVKFSLSAINQMDQEPNVIGTLAGMEEGSIFFIDGDNGFTAIRLDAVVGLADGSESFVSQQSSLKTKYDNNFRLQGPVLNALNKRFNVENNLHEF